MTDKPPRTALDRLRAGLRRRDEAAPAAGSGQPARPPAEEPPAPARDGPAEIESTALDEPAREPSAAAPRPDPEIVDMRRLMRVTIDGLKIDHDEQLSRTRLRINLRWAAAVMLGAAVLAGAGYAGYLHLSHNREELFQRHWPWRAHVWNRFGGEVMWCINEARKSNGPFHCRINNVSSLGPDCQRVELGGNRFRYRCPPWKTWPTDPAPRWGPDGPPQWSR